MEYGVIMAGGSGTRLWPLSRASEPKQLLPVVRGKSLLQLSFERLLGLLPPERIFVCTGAGWSDAVQANLPDLPPENVIAEPVGRDTANAVGLSAAVLQARDPSASFAIVTADHVIEPVDKFQSALRTAFSLVEKHPEALVTFGIVPTYGHTGLGYVHRGDAVAGIPVAHRVKEFKEKPDKETAERYVESQRYYWNSGMFVWRADTVLNELSTHLPAAYDGLTRIASAWNRPDRVQVLSSVYPNQPKISIDYAVMEPASQGKGRASVFVVEMDVKWLDVGSWATLAETMASDGRDNAIDAGLHVLVDSDSNIVFSRDPDHLVSLLGVTDMVVVHTRDATMVCPKRDAQRVKDLVEKVKQKYGERFM
jgi:mannose-1-phosphate guanylyltransferase